MNDRHHLLVVLAHPDDESFGLAGTMATLTDHGVDVTLVCATRGEVGEILAPELATRVNLGEVREGELRMATAHVGVRDVRFLGFRDSGMAGTEDNQDPRAFINADSEHVISTIVRIIEEVKPTIVITFGSDGIYGHPDHIFAHEVATAAVHRAAETGIWKVDALCYNAISRDRIRRVAELPNNPFSSMSKGQLSALGTPDDQITTKLDISRQLERKRAAISSHRTQIDPRGLWSDLPPEEVNQFMSTELLRLEPLPWSPESGDPLRDLLTS